MPIGQRRAQAPSLGMASLLVVFGRQYRGAAQHEDADAPVLGQERILFDEGLLVGAAYDANDAFVVNPRGDQYASAGERAFR